MMKVRLGSSVNHMTLRPHRGVPGMGLLAAWGLCIVENSGKTIFCASEESRGNLQFYPAQIEKYWETIKVTTCPPSQRKFYDENEAGVKGYQHDQEAP
jgi:hypothetical protein